MTEHIAYRYLNDEHRDEVARYLHDGYLLGAFAAAHKDVVDAAYIDAFGTHYTAMSMSGRPTDDWTKTSDGWLDTTLQAQMQYDLDKAKDDVRRDELRAAIAQADAWRKQRGEQCE